MSSPKIGFGALVDCGPLILIRDCQIQGWGCGRHRWTSSFLYKRTWFAKLPLSLSLGRSYAQISQNPHLFVQAAVYRVQQIRYLELRRDILAVVKSCCQLSKDTKHAPFGARTKKLQGNLQKEVSCQGRSRASTLEGHRRRTTTTLELTFSGFVTLEASFPGTPSTLGSKPQRSSHGGFSVRGSAAALISRTDFGGPLLADRDDFEAEFFRSCSLQSWLPKDTKHAHIRARTKEQRLVQ